MSASVRRHVHIPFVSKTVEDILLWRAPKDSALVLGGATAVFLAYSLNPFPAITIICYAIAITSLAAFFWALMGSFVSRTGPPVPAFLTRGLSPEEAHRFIDAALPTVNKVLATVGILASGKDMKASLSVVGGAYAAARIFAIIDPIALAYLLVLFGLTLPRAYEQKQAEVDHVVALVKGKVNEGVAKFNELVNKIPKAASQRKTQ